MEHNNNIPALGQGSGANNQQTALFGKLDELNKQVNDVMNDPNVRRIVLEVGIALLAKRYPALGVLLGTFDKTVLKQTTGRTAARRAMPVKKNGRGL